MKAFSSQITKQVRENYCRVRCRWFLTQLVKPESSTQREYPKTHDHTGRNGGTWLERNMPPPEPEPLANQIADLEPVLSYLQIERDTLEATAYHDELESKGEVVARITAFGGGSRGIDPGVVMRDSKRHHVDPILARYDLEIS